MFKKASFKKYLNIYHRLFPCPQQNGGSGGYDGSGQVSYEESGEYFFLPFSSEDVQAMATLKVADQVSFCISRDKRLVYICY